MRECYRTIDYDKMTESKRQTKRRNIDSIKDAPARLLVFFVLLVAVRGVPALAVRESEAAVVDEGRAGREPRGL